MPQLNEFSWFSPMMTMFLSMILVMMTVNEQIFMYNASKGLFKAFSYRFVLFIF